MSAKWPRVRLGEVLRRSAETLAVDPDTEYREITVKLWGKGVILRGLVPGMEIAGNRRFLAKAGQLIVSRIDARNGAMGIVPPELHGAAVTNDFPLFDVDPGRLDGSFLGWLCRTRDFVTLCQRASEGTTNRVRLQEERFLALEISLPSLAEQRRIVGRIEALAAKIAEGRGLRGKADEELPAVVQSRTTELFHQLQHHPRARIASLGISASNPIQIGPFGAQLHRSDFVEVGVPVLNVGNVWPEGLRTERLDRVTEAKADNLARYSVRTGDLLFARSGATLGKVCLVPSTSDGWLMSGHLFRVRFDTTQVEPRFAFVALRDARSVLDQVFGQVRGATRPGFNTTLLGNVVLPVPPLIEQQRIVAYLTELQSKVDALKRLQTRTAAELDALIPAILDRAFKGGL